MLDFSRNFHIIFLHFLWKKHLLLLLLLLSVSCTFISEVALTNLLKYISVCEFSTQKQLSTIAVGLSRAAVLLSRYLC